MILFLALITAISAQQVLVPPYIDIAKGKRVTATATCGEDYSRPRGVPGELFCELDGTSGIFGIRGLSCGYCVPGDRRRDHNIRNANDGTNKWWQSPPLSRGINYKKINVTLDLEQSYHVAYVIIKTANSPRPGVWSLERSNDGGRTYTPWHHFAPSSVECKQHFGVDSYLPIVQDDTVLCSTQYSTIPPFQNGEIHISLINGRPGARDFENSKTLQEWTTATNIRLRLLDIKTLLTDLLPLSLEDPTVTRRYFYSIKDISVGGRCLCNGFADECRPTRNDRKFACNCQYNTEGPRCDRCRKGYIQKKWQPRTKVNRFECQKCNCHGHSDECEYREEVEQSKRSLDINGKYQGGGVCLNCQHNTAGTNCQRCKRYFYKYPRVEMNDPRVCQACNCDKRYSTGLCADETGQCECKQNYGGRYCNQCNKGYHSFPACKRCDCDANGSVECTSTSNPGCRCKPGFTGRYCSQCEQGYYNFPSCKPCDCLTQYGAVSSSCDTNGQCQCRRGFTGRQCEQCQQGYHKFPYCRRCDCNSQLTTSEICEAGTGNCKCKPNYDGLKCGRCAKGFYGYPRCYDCGCSPSGSVSSSCSSSSGRCQCKPNFTGQRCGRCAQGFFGFPNCMKCDCNTQGSRHSECNAQSGQCSCKPTFSGQNCDRCLQGFYGFPNCKQFNFNPAGTITKQGERPGDCNTQTNGCICKEHVQGLECNECKPGFYNLQLSNRKGCSRCNCSQAGSISGSSSCSSSGDCQCKDNVKSPQCSQCQHGFYKLKQRNIFGCTGCKCNIGGSEDEQCDESSGRCVCKNNIHGHKCDRVQVNHYLPSLCDIKAEIEDGRTPDDDAIRFNFNQEHFPGYSWKGYVAINKRQPAVVITVNIASSSNYQIMFKYVMNQIEALAGTVTAYKASVRGQLSGFINFASTQMNSNFKSNYAMVQDTNSNPSTFPLSKGTWNIRLEVKQDSKLAVDNVVLIPQEYSNAQILKREIHQPCEVNRNDKYCNLYQHIDINQRGFITIEAENPGTRRQRNPPPLFNDTNVLSKIDYQTMISLAPEHNTQHVMFRVPTPGQYVAIVQYYHDAEVTKYLDIYVRSRTQIQRGKAWLQECRYTFGCRSTVLTRDTKETLVFNIRSTRNYLLTMVARQYATVAVDSVILIPLDKWHMDFSVPKLYCTTKDGKCAPLDYDVPKRSIVQLGQGKETDPRPSYISDPKISLKYLRPGVNAVQIKDIQAGGYHIVVHYHQPNNPSFEARTGVYSGRDGGFPGRTHFEYCPYLSGCRSVVQRSNHRSQNNVYMFENGVARLRFDLPEKFGVWIEYIMLIPGNDNRALPSSMFKPKPLDYSQDFLEQCSKDKNLCQISQSSDFCKEAMFTLTSDFNQGALPCDCNAEGSMNIQCDEQGGQCLCKENVIGRKCSTCKVGYYGFPNCKPCSCSNCDDTTGVCTCPPGVMGVNCDQCKPGTFGFDAVFGCQPCKCNDVGTTGQNSVCNVTNGQCPCKENFNSRRCSVCQQGYFSYPNCQKCDCLESGVTKEKCDRKTGKCFCQSTAIGSKCSECEVGYFQTKETKSEQMCTECWCSGKADVCMEATLFKGPFIRAMDGWGVSVSNLSVSDIDSKTISIQLSNIQLSGRSSDDKVIVYWIAPETFLGNKVTSYGGELTYHFVYDVMTSKQESLDEIPDIIMKGKEFTLKSAKEISRKPRVLTKVVTPFTENDWVLENGTSIDRKVFLSVISNIQSLHIRATHDLYISTSNFINAKLDSATEIGLERVYGVEKCFCPQEYDGPSCTQCADGYTRQLDGTCARCECMGKSERCHPETGVCRNCSDNTQGEHCELCQAGYYGDSCKPCTCPYINLNDSFADSCNINPNTSSLVCQCKEGYQGLRCDQCADGFYGNPAIEGGSCQKCKCSGNIDETLKGNCNSTTGECYKCLSNTTGVQCENCRNGYYGDAVNKQGCRDCNCDTCGTHSRECNSVSGDCICKANVVGKRCNKCALNTWNFNSCKGCETCNCGTASISNQCDLKTGRCQCQPTVIGKKCQHCAFGYFNYTSEGCKKCDCPNDQACDVNTGKCDCGVLYGKCDVCPTGYIIENNKCVECDNCIQNLLKRTHDISANISDVNINHFYNVNKTFFRLATHGDGYVQELQLLRKAIGGDDVNDNGDMGIHMVEEFKDCEFNAESSTPPPPPPPPPPGSNNIVRKRRGASIPQPTSTTKKPCPATLFKVINNTEMKFNSTYDKITQLESDAYESSRNASDNKKHAAQTYDDLKTLMKELQDIILSANQSLTNIDNGTNINANKALDEATTILTSLQQMNFTNIPEESQNEKLASINATDISNQLKNQSLHLEKMSANLTDQMMSFLKTLKNIRNEIDDKNISNNADDAERLIRMAKQFKYQMTLQSAVKIDMANNMTTQYAMMMVNTTKQSVVMATELFKELNFKRRFLSVLIEMMNERLKDLPSQVNMTIEPVEQSIKHAERLQQSAEELNLLLQNTNKFAESALRAAKVYKTIVDAINEALKTARMANDTADQANTEAKKALESAGISKTGSKPLEESSIKQAEDVSTVKVSLKGISMRLGELRQLRSQIMGRIDVVNTDIKKIAAPNNTNIGDRADNVSKQADSLINTAVKGILLARNTDSLVSYDNVLVDGVTMEIDDVNKFINTTADNVTKLENIIPTLVNTIKEVKEYSNQAHSSIDNIINKTCYLRYLIDNAHSIIDYMPLPAMKFNSSSQLILNAPKSVYAPTVFNNISMVFQSSGDGSLMFIGNHNDTNSGFMSLEIYKGNLIFSCKTNNGGVNVVKDPMMTIQSNWTYKVNVIRNIDTASVFLYRVLRVEGEQVQQVIPVSSTTLKYNSNSKPILTLGKEADFYVGYDDMKDEEKFEGCINGVVFDGELIGLWDWKYAKDVTGCSQEHRPYQQLDYTFEGDGYAQFNKNPSFSSTRTLEFYFTTLEADGLILYGVTGERQPDSDRTSVTEPQPIVNFVSFELQDGYFVSKFQMGNEKLITVRDEFLSNDGKRHRVKMVAKRKLYVQVFVDGQKLIDVKLDNDFYDSKKTFKNLYIGGVPMNGPIAYECTRQDFIGSIGNLKEGSKISDFVDSYHNIKPGYIVPFGHSASLPKETSNLIISTCDFNNQSNFAVTFQTKKGNGIIAILLDKDNQVITIRVVESKVNVIANNDINTVTLSTDVVVSDGMYHTVSLQIDTDRLKLVLATDEEFQEADFLSLESRNMVRLEFANLGLVKNIRHVFCSRREIDLSKGETQDAYIGSLALKPPHELGFDPTTIPLTTTTTTTTLKPTTTTSTTTLKPTTTTTTTLKPKTTTTKPTTTTTTTTTLKPTTTTTKPTTTTTTTTTLKPTTTTTKPTTTTTATTTLKPTTTTNKPTTTTTKPTTTTTTTTQKPTTTTTATTTTTTTTTTSKPTTTTTLRPVVQCASSLKPLNDAYGVGMVTGESYVEFKEKQSNIDNECDFEFSFYTRANDGILLLANPGTDYDYEAIYLADGKIVYTFNAGTGALEITTPNNYNDGSWHTVRTTRNQRIGSLYVDDTLIKTGQSEGGAGYVNNLSKLYVGGIPTVAKIPNNIPPSSRISIKGGVRGLKSFDVLLTPLVTVGTTTAYDDGLPLNNAVTFGETGGYIATKKVNIGIQFTLTLSVRSKSKSGYLFLATNDLKDYLSLEITADGDVVATLNNGDGEVKVLVKPTTSICGGNMNTISLTKYEKELKLIVRQPKSRQSETGFSKGASRSADTTSLLYFGGIPSGNSPPFVGCIQNIDVNGRRLDINSDDVQYNGASMRGCAA